MTTTRRALLPAVACTALVALAAALLAQDLRLPNKGKVKFAVIGDMGTASREQAEVGHQMALLHQKFDFPFVITLGDNLYGGASSPEDFRAKFEEPYKELIGECIALGAQNKKKGRSGYIETCEVMFWMARSARSAVR